MAKGRILNKKISLNKIVNELSPLSALTFTWTISHLDRDGRIHGDPTTLRSIVIPRRKDITDADMAKFIKEWAKAKLIQWYQSDGDWWIQFPKFQENQIGLRYDREPKSDIPAPADNIRQSSGNPPANIPLNTMEENIKEENISADDIPFTPEADQENKESKNSTTKEYTSSFLTFWKNYPRKTGKIDAYKCWKARLREGIKEKDLITAAALYADECTRKRKEEEHIKIPRTFLGPGEHWKEILEKEGRGGETEEKEKIKEDGWDYTKEYKDFLKKEKML